MLTLETAETDALAFYFGGSGTTVLTFNYVISEGELSSDLDYVSSEALNLNGGTINNSVGNAAILILPNPGDASHLAQKAIVIDGVGHPMFLKILQQASLLSVLPYLGMQTQMIWPLIVSL